MPSIRSTLETFQLDTSKEVKFFFPPNIYLISVTFPVFHLDTSKTVNGVTGLAELSNSLNISAMFVTFEVSQLDTSNSSKP